MRGDYVNAFDAFPSAVHDGEGGGNDEDELGLHDDVWKALARFAWAYVKGLGGLVMGVMDGFTRGRAGGAVGEAGFVEGYMARGVHAYQDLGGRR